MPLPATDLDRDPIILSAALPTIQINTLNLHHRSLRQIGHIAGRFTNPTQRQAATATDDAREQARNDAMNANTAAHDRATAAAQEWQRTHGDATLAETARHDKATEDAAARAAADKANNPKADNGRLDKSYAYNNNQLIKLHTPLADKDANVSQLIDSLDARTPAGDSTAAIQFLKAQAGGVGFRMNQAEIAQVTNGRSTLQNMEALAQKLSLDPAKALSLTPEQRADMRAIAMAQRAKVGKRLARVNAAQQSLIDGGSPEEHRNTLSQLQRDLAEMEAGGGETAAASGGGLPPGVTVTKR